MKVQIIAAIALTTVFINSASAAESDRQQERQAAMIEQRKTEQLRMIDERIHQLQEKKSCMQAASTHEALKACHEKFRSEMQQERATMKK